MVQCVNPSFDAEFAGYLYKSTLQYVQFGRGIRGRETVRSPKNVQLTPVNCTFRTSQVINGGFTKY